MSYKPTGYPVGAPRTGEVRPDTPANARRRARYAERMATDPIFAANKRAAWHNWNENNPGRAAQLKRNSLTRLKGFAAALEAKTEFTVIDPEGAEIEIFTD